jgi:hypothetical protein
MGDARTLKGTNQRLGVEGGLRRAGSAVCRHSILGKIIDEVADDEFSARKVFESVTGPFGEEGLGPRPSSLHGRRSGRREGGDGQFSFMRRSQRAPGPKLGIRRTWTTRSGLVAVDFVAGEVSRVGKLKRLWVPRGGPACSHTDTHLGLGSGDPCAWPQ